jgi:hypothetical protein
VVRRPAKKGASQKAATAMTPPEAPPETAADAAGDTAEWMVRLFVSALPVALNAADGSAKLQEKYAGSVPHEKLTEPVKPPCGVSVTLTTPELANGIVRLLGFTAIVKPGTTMVSIKVPDVLAVKFASPA